MPGGRIATAITEHIVNAVASTKVQMAPHMSDLFMEMQHRFFDLTGKESAYNFGPTLRKLLAAGETDPETARLLTFIMKGQGQFATMLGYTVAGTAVGTGLGAFFANALQPAVGPAVAQFPNLPMNITDAVRAQVTQQTGHYDMGYEVAQQGIEGGKFDLLVNMAKTRPTVADIFDLLNRGHTNTDFARTMFHRLGYDIEDTEMMLELRNTMLSPQELAALTNFGVYTEEQSWPLAARTGISQDEYHALVMGDGQPPSVQELLFAYRRGVIDKQRLQRGIQQGPLRSEWFDIVESMGQIPMSTSDAIEALVQGHLDDAKARAIALQNGLIPDQFDPLLETAGEAPGVVQMLELLNRGFMTQDEVVAGIKETRLKNKYIPFMLKFAIKVPPERSVVSLLSKGAITTAVALDMLLQLGYTKEIAAALVNEATATKTTKLRDLTEAQVVAMYENRAMSRDDTHAMLLNMRYDDNEANLILDLADARWATKHINAATTRVQKAFLTGNISDQDASTQLDSIGVPAMQRDDLLALWKVEQMTVSKSLTIAQMTAAMKKGIMTPDQVYPRIVGDGYSTFDARVIIQLAGFDISNPPQ